LFRNKQYVYDFYLKDYNCMIECQGDYWHANPICYPDKSKWTDVQKTNVRRDHYKRRFAREAGFFVLYIWGHDLKTRPNFVINTLEKYIRKSYEKAKDLELLS